MRRAIIIVVSTFVLFTGFFVILLSQNKSKSKYQLPSDKFNLIQPLKIPDNYKISKSTPGYLSYNGVINQMKLWNQEAPEITELGIYGRSTKGNDIYYLRIGNKTGPKVMITACIHGNEKIANAVVMGIIGKMLTDYGHDETVTKLIKSRDVYWVPIVSPDSFIADSRYVDGIDPNRNFPYPGKPDVNSIPPIKSIRDFFIKHKFKAVISTHAFGRVYIYPFGYTNQACPDHQNYRYICGRMAEFARYRSDQIRNVGTALPYHGFEADWFYANCAFAMVAEVGEQFKPPDSDIQPEITRNYKAYMLFIEEAPVVELKLKIANN